MTTLQTLASLNGAGEYPDGLLVADANGDLFGATQQGGPSYGTVFELARTATGYASAPTALVSFNGTDGSFPNGSLVTDASGNLFGTTGGGGAGLDGEIFEVGPAGLSVLVPFNGTDGANPSGGLLADANANLFGTTANGGVGNEGTVFELARTATGYAAAPTVLVSFAAFATTSPANSPVTEIHPDGPLVADASGDLFGTTEGGGYVANTDMPASGDGTVFELARTATGYASTPTFLASFAVNSIPGSLVLDANGDLFGTTAYGGAAGYGTVFEFARTATGYAGLTVLASFSGTNGKGPGGLVLDAQGNLFGTTAGGGLYGAEGTVFELARTATGYAGTPTVLATFSAPNGSAPQGLIADASGTLFGDTAQGGTNDVGTIFEVTSSGYVVPCFCRGTRILTARGEVAVEELRVGDLAVTLLGRGSVLKPVRWLGHRRIDLARHPHAAAVNPVRICAGALAEGRPARDLLVSPGHRFALDGVLVAAIDLVNGATVAQEAPGAVEYWHVELDAHDVLLAEGAEAESYQDTGNRGGFENAVVVALHPPADTSAGLDGAAPQPCLPYGVPGAAVRARLRARAEALGWTLGEDPAPWLEVAGARIEPQRRGGRYRFAVPAGCTGAWLRSRWVRPCDVSGGDVRDGDAGGGDERRLGLSLHRLVLVTAGGAREVALDDPLLAQGFSFVEREAGWCWRWTDGAAWLALPALARGEAVTAVEVAVELGLAVWAPPAAGARDGILQRARVA